MDALFGDIQTIVQTQRSLAYLAVFIGGLLSAASPCVIAAIPLIVGYVGGYSEGNVRKAALYSLAFVLGLSITFTALGAAASVLGGLLGFLGAWLPIGLAILAALMGLHLMGLITVPLPFQKTREVKSKGIAGALLLGLLTGVASSPCATPVLAVILAYVASEGDLWYGSTLLFSYSVGHCALLFAAGLSIGMTERLLGSTGFRRFSLIAKKGSGFVLLTAAAYIVLTTL
jgi:cytochrome c biogenesis protein CcdA